MISVWLNGDLDQRVWAAEYQETSRGAGLQLSFIVTTFEQLTEGGVQEKSCEQLKSLIVWFPVFQNVPTLMEIHLSSHLNAPSDMLATLRGLSPFPAPVQTNQKERKRIFCCDGVWTFNTSVWTKQLMIRDAEDKEDEELNQHLYGGAFQILYV